MKSRITAISLLSVVLASTSTAQRAPLVVQPQQLARIWDAEHVSPAVPPLLTHADVVKRLAALSADSRSLFQVEKVGESVEGRSISVVRAGTGRFHVLLW